MKPKSDLAALNKGLARLDHLTLPEHPLQACDLSPEARAEVARYLDSWVRPLVLAVRDDLRGYSDSVAEEHDCSYFLRAALLGELT